MKKIQITLIMAMIISIMTTTTAQITAANFTTAKSGIFASKNPKSNPAKTKSLVKSDKAAYKTNKAAYKADKAGYKALSDFQTTYKDAPTVEWSFEPTLIVAEFTKDDIQTFVVYNKRGRWLHTMQTYQESKMPADLRLLIKNSEYADYNIEFVHQIQEGKMTFYIVNLSDSKKFKQVLVYNEEINVLEEFDIQK